MKFKNLFTFLVPKDRVFYDLFSKSSANLVETATQFNEFVCATSSEKRSEIQRKISDLEHVGDAITHEIFKTLSTQFITPFDRDDIHYLTSSLDDIVDYIDGAAKRMSLYRVEEFTLPMQQLAGIILESAKEIHVAISNLNKLENVVRIREALVHINSLENRADDVFDGAIANLFHEEKDAIKLIKLKDVLSSMETATDKCEDVANVLETILIKHS